jgi:hypothetical protein
MQIIVTFTNGQTYTDRARDMHNAVPRAEEWAAMATVADVVIVHEQAVLWESAPLPDRHAW